MSREKVCLTLFLSSAEGWEGGSHQSKRPGRAQLPTSGCGAPAPLCPILGGWARNGRGSEEGEVQGPVPANRPVQLCPWLCPHRPHPPTSHSY